jgi:hypothetical protein
VGTEALSSAQSTSNVVAIGYQAAQMLDRYGYTDNTDVVAVGANALGRNESASSVTAIGGKCHVIGMGGSNDVAVGDSVLALQTGSENTVVGSKAVVDAQNGSRLTAIGFNTNVGSSFLSNATPLVHWPR